jgi:competence transcription factor ComK
MRHLIIILFAAFLIVLPSCKYFRGGIFGKKAKTTAILKVHEDSVRVADSLQKIKDHQMALEVARIDSARTADEAQLAKESKFRFNIIVGSFITPSYADKLAERYKKLGYDPKILDPEGSKFEFVSVEGHNNFREALKRLKQFKDTVQTQSWIYVKK